MRSDRSNARIVLAPNNTDKNGSPIYLSVSREKMGMLADHGRFAQWGEFAGLVHGNIMATNPHVPIGHDERINHGTNGLMDSVALFQGLHRPMIDWNLDKDVYIYVMNHPFTYYGVTEEKYEPSWGPRSSRLRTIISFRLDTKPNDSVFVTYVKLFESAIEQPGIVDGDQTSQTVVGEVMSWEWILADPDEPTLPYEYRARYARRVW